MKISFNNRYSITFNNWLETIRLWNDGEYEKGWSVDFVPNADNDEIHVTYYNNNCAQGAFDYGYEELKAVSDLCVVMYEDISCLIKGDECN